jgi:hypothetical protein
MTPRWANLSEADQSTFRAITAFLMGRLEERATIEWALRLPPNERVKRAALLDLVDGPQGSGIREPWRTAWRLINESWQTQHPTERDETRTHHLGHRVAAGDRSGVIIEEISDLVAPRLGVKPFTEWDLLNRKPPKRPKLVEQLFSAKLTSSDVIDPRVLRLDRVREVDFLVELANRLDAVIMRALDLARRLNWNTKRQSYQIGRVHRVYYVLEIDQTDGQHDPDEFNHGIAASVKLLHFVVARIAAFNIQAALAFGHRWKVHRSPLHTRLWSALARDSRIASAADVASALLSMDDELFWNQNTNPEIAELRARRFNEFSPPDQAAVLARLRKLPPRSQWSKGLESERLQSARLYWALRELRRIEIAGAALPESTGKWMASRISQFPELTAMSRIDDGFMGPPVAFYAPRTDPDARYDVLNGVQRLNTLEEALSSTRIGLDDDPAQGAANWIRKPGNALLVIADFEAAPDVSLFPQVLDRFGWTHAPSAEPNTPTGRDQAAAAARLLPLIAGLTESTLRKCIDGLAHWLWNWRLRTAHLQQIWVIWRKLWPIAVEVTNQTAPPEELIVPTVMPPSEKNQRIDIDTVNTAVGKLMGVFWAKCPPIQGSANPFEADDALREVRDQIISAQGRAGLIAKHWLIEGLADLLDADRAWAEQHLVRALSTDDFEALALWHAVGRRTQFTKVLQVIGDRVAERATDLRLDRETRRSLTFSLIVECLHALKEDRPPAVPYTRVEQMLRSLDDEVRAYGASAIKRFVRDISRKVSQNQTPPTHQTPPTPEELFRSAAKPLIEQVWPQERSLSTPGVSRALSELPAIAREAFAEAVEVVDRFLVPFDCWSMLEYGLYGEEDGEPKLANIDTEEKAKAFLRMLDHTIGTAEGAVIPIDLSDALDQIHKIAPNLADLPSFRRLATAARRV